jgi:hypothetical protein
MSEIIEILTAKNVASCAINTALASSPITLAVGQIPYTTAVGARQKFVAGDSFTLLSFGVIVPHLIGWGDVGSLSTDAYPFLTVYGERKDDGTQTVLRGFPLTGGLAIPYANYEMSAGVYCNWNSNTGTGAIAFPPVTAYRLVGGMEKENAASFGLSTAGLPAVLDGVTLQIDTFIKILHNLPLQLW